MKVVFAAPALKTSLLITLRMKSILVLTPRILNSRKTRSILATASLKVRACTHVFTNNES